MNASALASLCGDITRPAVANPFSIELDGAPWAVATNGWALLMLRGPTDLAANPVMPPDVIRDATLARVGPLRAVVPWADLVNVFRGETEMPCPECEAGVFCCPTCGTPGLGCFTCDAKGTVIVRRAGDMCGIELDGALAWRYLRGVYSPTVRVHPPVGRERDVSPAMFAAEDDSWRVLVMPMWRSGLPHSWSFPRGLLDPELTNLSKGGTA